MPSFIKNSGGGYTFGANEYLRSTRDVKKESYTVAAASVPNETIGGTTQKMLRSGEVIAKITSGPDAGKVGPFQAAATDGRQTTGNIVGLNDTDLPWQLLESDREIAVTYECTAVQAWCTTRDAAGARVALDNTNADLMRGLKGLEIHFK